VTKRNTIEDCHRLAKSRNGKCISTTYKNNRSHLIWKCENDHQWPAVYYAIQGGNWCPYCASKIVTIEDCIKLATSKNGKFLSKQYIDAHTTYNWECCEGHRWPAVYFSIKSGCWCPKCGKLEAAKKRRNSIEDCHKVASQNNGKCLSLEYKNNNTMMTWECERGHQWHAIYNNIKNGRWCPYCSVDRRIKTNLEKYGASNPQQNPEVAFKVAKSVTNSCILRHWFSQEEVVCVGSYEKKTVEYFNHNRIDYLWQPQIFTMPNGKTYRPDCYLPDQDLWIEIKGYFRKDALEKWEWFQSEYPNSELWDKKRLKELKIL
jgi:hypothetical protein